jgi:DhnA family fructose-bisphosphate aldolase class Ia
MPRGAACDEQWGCSCATSRSEHRYGAKSDDETVLAEARAIRDGGGFGSIIGRNSFQRAKPDALNLLAAIMEIYSGA